MDKKPTKDAEQMADLPRRSVAAGRGERLRLLETAFTNWRVPGYVGSVAYRVRRFSPTLFDALMNIRFDMKTKDGTRVLARVRDMNGPAEVFGLGEYDLPWIDWSSLEYVLDIGAHVGSFTLWVAARSRCKILALEPNPATRRLLESNVKNQQLQDRVAVRGWALAGGPGLRRLRPAADSAASALVFEVAVGDLQVEAIDLAGAITASEFPHLDLVKLDIEGAEYEVFHNAPVKVLQAPRYWVVECHAAAGVSWDAIETALTSAGFEVATVAKPQGQKLLVARRQDGTSHQT
jgi:FkbM family methyltransferase